MLYESYEPSMSQDRNDKGKYRMRKWFWLIFKNDSDTEMRMEKTKRSEHHVVDWENKVK
jgi:hypothetical protein